MRIKASLVVMLIDDFNNRMITGNKAKVSIADEKPPIQKPEGYSVFTNLSTGYKEVVIESSVYEGQVVPVTLTENDLPYSLLKVRLSPGRTYLLPSGTTCLEGRAMPGSQMRIFSRGGEKTWKLLEDYSYGAGNHLEIGIYHPEDHNLEGQILYIENRDQTKYEFLRILKAAGSGGRYRLSFPLKNAYKKIGTAIYPVHLVCADEQGYFFLPILNMKEEAAEFFYETEGAGQKMQSFLMRKGMVNKVNLRKEEE